MNTEKMILAHILAKPGMLTSEIAAAIQMSRTEVSKLVGSLTAVGELYRDDKCRYFVTEPATEEDQKFAGLCDKAYELEDRQWWRRAAGVWLKAMDATRKEGLRQKAVLRRARCLNLGSVRCTNYGGLNSGALNSESGWSESYR